MGFEGLVATPVVIHNLQVARTVEMSYLDVTAKSMGKEVGGC